MDQEKILCFGIIKREIGGAILVLPILDSLEPMMCSTLQGVIWFREPTPEERAVILNAIPFEVQTKEFWPQTNGTPAA